MKCPSCKRPVVQRDAEGFKLRLHGQVLVRAGMLKSTCFWCKSQAIEIPLDKLAKKPHERFVIATKGENHGDAV